MDFVHPVLVGGLALGAVPILIHILTRRRYKVVRWGAMKYLLAAIEETSRRVQIEDLILLALRVTAVCLMALALARPYLRSRRTALPAGPRLAVVLLDNSPSMQAKRGSLSRWDLARGWTREMLGRLPAGSAAAVIPLARQSGVAAGLLEPTRDLSVASRAVDELGISARRADPASALTAAIGLADASDMVSKTIYLVSDFQAGDWPSAESKVPEHLTRLARLTGVRIVAVQCSGGERDNIAVADLERAWRIVKVDGAARISGVLTGYGGSDRPARDVTATLHVNGVKVDSRSSSLAAGQSRDVVFFAPLDREGDHAVELRTTPDISPADDARYLTIEAREEVRVLCVDGDPHPEEDFLSETFYLRFALSPGATALSPIALKVITAEELSGEDLKNYDLVVLANVGRIEPTRARDLAAYVRSGRAVLFFLGELVESDSYHATVFGGADSLLPIRLGSVLDLPPLAGAARDGWQVDSATMAGPVMTYFKGDEDGGLKSARFAKAFEIDPVPASRNASSAGLVHARLDPSGAPLLVSADVGRGRVAVVNTTADVGWGNLPLKPAFTAMVQRLVVWLLEPAARCQNLLPEQPYRLWLPISAINTTVTIRRPDGRSTSLQPTVSAANEGRTVVEFADTSLAGFYEAAWTEPTGPQRRLFAVNIDPAEADLTTLQAASLRELAGGSQLDWHEVTAGAGQVERAVERGGGVLAVGHSRRGAGPGCRDLAGQAIQRGAENMKPLLNRFLGITEGDLTRLWVKFGTTWPAWAMLAAIMAIGLAAWWAYRPTRSGALEPRRVEGKASRRGLPGLIRWTMAGLRIAGLVLVSVVLLEPLVAFEHTLGIKPRLLVLLDDSQSMTIRDRRGSAAERLDAARVLGQARFSQPGPTPEAGEAAECSRAELLAAALRNSELDLLDRLGRSYEVRCYRFSQEVSELKGESVEQGLGQLRFDGPVTDLARTIRGALSELRGRPAAGILLLSDGASNRGEAPAEAAAAARAEGISIFPVVIGLPQARDLQVAGFISDDVVFLNDTVPVYACIRQRGYDGETVAVELRKDDELADRKTAVLTGEAEQTVELRFTPRTKGEATYRLTVEQRPDELISANNSLDRRIKVIDEAIKVLAIEQAPRWDFRFLKGSLLRDKRVQLKVVVREADGVELAAAGMPEYLPRIPDDRQELFKYDVIILGDVPAEAFSKEQLKLLEEFVAGNGGGLCFAAGMRYNPATFRNTVLEPLVPVVFQAQPEPPPEAELFAPLVQPLHLEITREGLASPVCVLADGEAANAATWRRLPPFYWHFPAQRLRPAAVALALVAESKTQYGKVPVFAYQYYGRGVTFYVGIDSTWRWRDRVGEKLFTRFWGQAIHFLSMAHLLGESKRVQIATDRKTYSIGDEVKISARVLDKAFRPLAATATTARITLPEQEPQETSLPAVPGQPGMFAGQHLVTAAGDYTVQLAGEEAEGKATFQVRMPQLEFDRPEADEATLRAVAQASGGRLFGLADLPSLPDAIAKARPLVTVRGESLLWDRWTMLLLLVVVLGAEWLMRKLTDLA